MLRLSAGALLAVVLTFALAPASEVKGTITRVSGNSISVTTKSDDDRTVMKTLTADKEVMVYRLVKKKRVEVSDGLKADDFKNLGKSGVTATLIINDDTRKVTEITIGGKKK